MSAAASSMRKGPVPGAFGSVVRWLVEGAILGVVISLVGVAALHLPASDPLDGPPGVLSGIPFLGGVLGLVMATLTLGALVRPVARWVGTPVVVALLGATTAWFNTAVYVGGLIEPIEMTGLTPAPLITGVAAMGLILWRARVRLRASADAGRT